MLLKYCRKTLEELSTPIDLEISSNNNSNNNKIIILKI